MTESREVLIDAMARAIYEEPTSTPRYSWDFPVPEPSEGTEQ